MTAPRRALLMASGANRGAYYAGFPRELADAGVRFELLAGVSAGGVAAAWIAAGDPDRLEASWREASRWRIAVHPFLALGRRRSVDQLIRKITLRMMAVERARTAPEEILLGVARVERWPALGLPKVTQHVLSSRQARDEEEFGRMLRATAFVPWMNGCRAAIEIDGERYLDGGLVSRVPIAMVPPDRGLDEIWVSACSPHGLRELQSQLESWSRSERLVIVTPSEALPAGRWTMEWSRIAATMDIGRRDMATAIRSAADSSGHVVVGVAGERLHCLVGQDSGPGGRRV